MFHFFDTLTNTRGDSLPGWQAECVDYTDGITPVAIFSDELGTAIVEVSGVVNRALADGEGNVDFYVPDGTYSIRYYNAAGVFQRAKRYVPMYGSDNVEGYLDTDPTLAANSDDKIATQAATKAYVDGQIETVGIVASAQSRIIQGGEVVNETNYNFRVSAAEYLISGNRYTSVEQTIALTSADATLNRIDVIYVDTAGAVGVITGTAAAQPSEPDYDPVTQLKLTFVYIPAASTSPSVTNESVYLENTEWTSSTSGTGFNANSTNNPYAGSKCIEGTTVANAAYVQLQRGTAMTLDSYTYLVLFIRSKAAWASGRVLRAQFLSAGVAKGSPVTIASGFWGFDSSITTGYQQVAIPLTQFVVPAGTSINQLRITDSGGSIGFYIDSVILQGQGTAMAQGGTAFTQDQADARYLRLTGGTLVGDLNVPDEAYDATAWNGSTEVPTKNAVRDKIEALVSGFYTDENAQDAVGGILTDSATIDFTYNDAVPSITASVIASAIKPTESLIIACSDETTAITTGTAKVTFRMPYPFTVTAVRASVTTAPTGATILIDINEAGASILSTKLMIDATEKTSTTAATPYVLSDTSLADDAEITIDFDQVGSTIAGAGVKVYLIGMRT